MVRITQLRLMKILIGCPNGLTIYLTNLTKLMLIWRGTVQLQPIVARNSLSIVQQPNISNGQTTIVEIFDSAGGSSFYEFILTGQGLSGYPTDPQDPDSDNDGFNDGMEVTSGVIL